MLRDDYTPGEESEIERIRYAMDEDYSIMEFIRENLRQIEWSLSMYRSLENYLPSWVSQNDNLFRLSIIHNVNIMRQALSYLICGHMKDIIGEYVIVWSYEDMKIVDAPMDQFCSKSFDRIMRDHKHGKRYRQHYERSE